MDNGGDWDPFKDPADDKNGEPDRAGVKAPASSETSLLPMATCWYEKKPVVSGRALRVACLHGTSSSCAVLKMQLRALQNLARDSVEFVYIPGNVELTEEDSKHPSIAQMRAMFPDQPLVSYAKYVKTPPLPEGETLDYQDLGQTVEYLQSKLRENTPIDGILGFSQGSNMASMLAGEAVRGVGVPLAFVVHLSSSWGCWTERVPNLFTEPLQIPSFHIWGKSDPLAMNQASSPERMMELYSTPECALHNDDHRPFPKQKGEAEALATKVIDFMKRATRAG